MDKRNVAKTMMFFEGLMSRAEENIDFFIEIKINFKSGTKVFPMMIKYRDNNYETDFQAVKRTAQRQEVCESVLSALKEFDEAEIIYAERGTNIIITADRKNVKMRQEDAEIKTAESNLPQGIGGGREYVVNPAIAKDLLKEIGILAENGKIKNDKIRKYNQIDYFVELMKDVLDSAAGEDEEIVILDCACGKSYLSFVLNFYLKNILKKKCSFIGVDYSDTVIKASKRMAKNLGYNNMEFIKADLREYTPSKSPTAVISLHACDTATDMAIALGIRTGAKAIVAVPCCHKDILKQYSYKPFEAITKHGILKARLADTLTDGLRSIYLESRGYKVSLIEYISPLETPKNIMIRAVYTGKKSAAAMEEYRNLTRMLNVNPAVERFLENGKDNIGKKFKLKYSEV